MAESYPDLEAAVEGTVEEINGQRHVSGWHIDVGEHSTGPALDVWKESEGERIAPDKVHRDVVMPAIESGYIVGGINRIENSDLYYPHVRFFLHEADEYDFGGDEDTARAEGFAAGMLFGATAALWADVDYDVDYKEDDVLDINEAAGYVDGHNDLAGVCVESGKDHIDLHVATTKDPEDVAVPNGWEANDKRRQEGTCGGVDINRVEDDDEDDHIDAWGGFFEGSYDPAETEDIDANEIVRELEGVETAEDCVDRIYENTGNYEAAHVSDMGPDEKNPYTIVDDDQHIPEGWERAESDSNYLVKE